MLKWYLDENRNIVKLKSKIDRIQSMQVKYGGRATQKLMQAHYPYTNKAIDRIIKLINDCFIS